MKMLILSDSHGRLDLMRRAIDLHRDADHIVFLGDGIADVRACEKIYDRPIHQVAGNCDIFTALFSELPTEQPLIVEDKRILLTHGHTFHVKGGREKLLSHALCGGYDIVLYGHTHDPAEMYCHSHDTPVYLFNPGSIGCPRHGQPSYGLLQIQSGQILLSHGEVPY